ncbi:MAG: hypothetical protein Q8R18_03825 [bacterium]|nr:hypothetical protein [bacterium]
MSFEEHPSFLYDTSMYRPIRLALQPSRLYRYTLHPLGFSVPSDISNRIIQNLVDTLRSDKRLPPFVFTKDIVFDQKDAFVTKKVSFYNTCRDYEDFSCYEKCIEGQLHAFSFAVGLEIHFAEKKHLDTEKERRLYFALREIARENRYLCSF